MLSHKRGYAAVLGPPTTSQLYAFWHKFSIRAGGIHSVAYRPSHYDRLSGEQHISRRLEHPDGSMVIFTDHPAHVPLTIADTGYLDPSVAEDSPTYA